MLSKIIVSFLNSNHWDFDFIGNTHTESYYGYFQVFKHYMYVFFYSNIINEVDWFVVSKMPQYMLEDWMKKFQNLFYGNYFSKQGQLVS